ncbi:phosphopantetheine-binding protein [Rhizobium sp. CG5]|uniref:phosphopantetheine-binding protein n=1 Tax=Rhizobium sp. CG5 TaxID=2726076 RepID=UPI0020340935|nr:phosphopantetheine-binding protein [Rhizobium sp. CG5]MCM2476481.1 phosphopantetheine-binding protein [Rhizobium sp. CG5]
MREDFTLETMRGDIAAVIHVDPRDIADDDNLMDAGLDSMRALNLVLLWQERGVTLDFSELAARLTLSAWWAIAARRIAQNGEA